jgi:hypothetical protein
MPYKNGKPTLSPTDPSAAADLAQTLHDACMDMQAAIEQLTDFVDGLQRQRRPAPTCFQMPFGPTRTLTIVPQVHQLQARQFFVSAAPDGRLGAALSVFPIELLVIDHSGTVDIVFHEMCTGIVTLVPLPDAFGTAVFGA